MTDYSQFVTHKIMPDKKLAAIVALTYGRGRITFGVDDGVGYEKSW